ncbi:MAG: TorD/DmsD family molecular chaperone [Thiogranum sp.]
MNSEQETVHAGADLDGGERARADIYRLLAALLAGPPDQALLELLCALEPDTTAGSSSMNSTWQELRAAAENTGPQDVGEEYFNLFIGLGRGELVPYASWYVHGLLMEKLLASLRDELAVLGFEREDGVSEPEDHVAALCEVMGVIICDSELSLRQTDFFATYLEPWMGRFFVDLEEAETAVFSKAVGRLGQQFLDVERQYFSLPE